MEFFLFACLVFYCNDIEQFSRKTCKESFTINFNDLIANSKNVIFPSRARSYIYILLYFPINISCASLTPKGVYLWTFKKIIHEHLWLIDGHKSELSIKY